jgi:CheY-like chemotaxis protein
VQDSGTGFDPQGSDRLFEAFYTTKSGGMGIGLSVSRSIIEAHHGRLWATLNEGPGATFSFSIPRLSGSLEAAPDPESRPIVCVVEDDDSVRRALERLIRWAGWTSETFSSAEEFLARPAAVMPSCLVLDVNLPGMNGLDLQARIAADRRDLPIIFLTGHADVPTTVRAMKAGAVELLTKPFADTVLLEAIRQAVERSQGGSPAMS